MSLNIDLTTIIAISAAVLAAVAIVITLIKYAKVKNYLSDTRSQNGFDSYDGNIRSEIVDVVQNSMTLKQSLSAQQPQTRTIVQKAELSTENFNAIVETVLLAVEEKMAKKQLAVVAEQPAAKPKEATEQTTEEKPIEKPSIVYKYATSYDIKKRTFYNVEDRPSEDTIYELSINADNGNFGTFTIYKHAYKKVTECQDFLEGACDVSGSGAIIQIVEQGQIAMEGGKWTVEKPLEMKFV